MIGKFKILTAVDLVFPTRTVIERVTDKVFRDADVGACTVEISPTALGCKTEREKKNEFICVKWQMQTCE